VEGGQSGQQERVEQSAGVGVRVVEVEEEHLGVVVPHLVLMEVEVEYEKVQVRLFWLGLRREV
jgi:hypothetical protein